MLSVFLALAFLAPAWPALEYANSQALTEQLAGLARQEPNLVRVRELARSREKRPVWLVDIGIGSDENRSTRPAVLVVAGIEGNDLVGPFTARAWIERLMKQYREDPPTAELLKKTTIYVVPCLNPDALERFFASPRIEGGGNNVPRDDDHDGLVDEDPCEDLNGDGLITMMRVEDKEGEYILDPNEKRLLLKADPLQGEKGSWKLLPEGIDNDHDKRWNEDGPGGGNFNRSFPHNYQYFTAEAGVLPISQAETRALADFVVAHPNIGIILTYGAADNLRKTPRAAKPPGRAAVDERDVGYYETFGKLYRKAIGLGKEMETLSEPGTFSDWMYFQRGRLSLAVRPWDVALARELSEPSKEKASTAEDKKEGAPTDPNASKTDKKPAKKEDKRDEDERKELKWFDEHAPEAFIPWQAVEHPDFKGQRVEVGGYRPFALANPPAPMLAEVAAKQGDFLMELARRLPRIGIGKIECHVLADSVYGIEIHVVNTGFLPTVLAHGETTQEVYPTRLILDLEPACFLAGARTTFLPTIAGSGGTAKARFTIHVAHGQEIHFKVVSMLGGQAEGTIPLLQAAENK
ncbi:MAG: M14 family metallopeptidase [Planctomycetes bacterium]|nr:M14 family metallopeptidase [Planctomycetota bacterium]